MRVIPVDASPLKFLVVGEPAPHPQVRAGQAVLVRNTGKPLRNLKQTVIGAAGLSQYAWRRWTAGRV